MSTTETAQASKPTPAEVARRLELARNLIDATAAIQTVHSPRYFDGDGYGWKVCAEDRQSWPCHTVQMIDEKFGVERLANGNVRSGCRDYPFSPNSDFDA